MLMSVSRPIYQGYRRYRATHWLRLSVFLAQGFWAGCVYRDSHDLFEWTKGSAFRLPLRLLVAQKAMEIVIGISLSPECETGAGCYIGRYGPPLPSPRAPRS